MLTIFILSTIFVASVGGITTIPFSVGLLAVSAVLFQKSLTFFLALGLGLFLDLTLIRPLGYTSLVFTIFIFILSLYERKFETRTLTFVFFSTFIGSLIYLNIFHYDNVLLQSLVGALLAVLFFKLLWLKLAPRSETI